MDKTSPLELEKKYSQELPFLKEIEFLKEDVDSHRPLESDLQKKIFQKLRLEWNYNSNAIEGNSFTYGETVALLMEGITAKGKPFKDALDIKGHNNAIDFMMSMVKNERELNEVDIRTLHEILLVEDYSSPAITNNKEKTRKIIRVGVYKTSPNHVETQTGEIHYYASVEDTPKLMSELVEWYNSIVKIEGIHPLVIASIFHHRFVSIHPFDDGNGRMARLLTNLVLLRFGYPVSVIKNESKKEYYAYLSQADNGELIPIIEFISQSVKDSLEIYIRAINGEDISSPSDIDKEIALFRQELSMTKDKIVTKKPDSALQISHTIFGYLKTKLDLLSDLFQSKNEVVREAIGKGKVYSVTDKVANLAEYQKLVGDSLNNARTVAYQYYLQKDLKENRHNIGINIQINLENKTYIIIDGESNRKITKYYGEEILDEKTKKFLEEVVKNTMSKIKKLYVRT